MTRREVILSFVGAVIGSAMVAATAEKKPKPEQIDHDAVTQRIEAKIDRLEHTVADQHEALIKRLEACLPR